jgi:cation transport protein ChaC
VTDQDLWVFGYGSLMWRPGFDSLGVYRARIFGFHRSFCVLSHVHRGTPEKPGLVFGLDRGGSCHGLAFHIAAAEAAAVRDYLIAREQVTLVYRESQLPAYLNDGRVVRALCFTVDHAHPQYAGKLPFADQVALIRQGVGQSGANCDYLADTVTHLRGMGIVDHGLQALHQTVSGKVELAGNAGDAVRAMSD